MTAHMRYGVLVLFAMIGLAGCEPAPSPETRAAAVSAFATVHEVFQHPRCRNCHIEGDAPLQFDESVPHAMGVMRGPDGHGAAGLPCGTCHGEANPPDSYGPHAPPGAPHWGLPPPDQKMAWFGLDASALCEMIKDRSRNGDRDFAALTKHVAEDKLVLWGWAPGGNREPVPVPHEAFVADFRRWADAGGPCPESGPALARN